MKTARTKKTQYIETIEAIEYLSVEEFAIDNKTRIERNWKIVEISENIVTWSLKEENVVKT